jgi:hypothetical protein
MWTEKETEQKYAAENGILKLRYHGLKEEIEKQKDDIKRRFEKEKALYEQIHILEKDIEGFKKEIRFVGERRSIIVSQTCKYDICHSFFTTQHEF